MTITQLEYALAVNKFRHFNKAAKACHVTQPTLSMQLSKLEDELGVVLFDRSKNPIIPTLEGEKILRQAQVVIKEFKKIGGLVEEGRREVSGDFRLAVIPTLAPYLIPLFIKSFNENYPKVNLTVEEAKTEDIIRLLDEDDIDAGLLVSPLHDDRIIERTLYYEQFHIFASPDHDYLRKRKIKEKDLSYEDLWLLNQGHCFRDQVLNICKVKKRESRKNLSFESGNLETLKNMVLKSGGYTFLPHMALEGLSGGQKKLVRDFTTPVPTREVSLVHSRTFLKERIIDALEQEILKNLPSDIASIKNKAVEVVEIY